MCVCSGSTKIEDAVECYHRAANLYKMSKNWTQAGSAFCEAANWHCKAGSRHDAATNYIDAANCYKKADINGRQPNWPARLITFIHPWNLVDPFLLYCRGCKLFPKSDRDLHRPRSVYNGS